MANEISALSPVWPQNCWDIDPVECILLPLCHGDQVYHALLQQSLALCVDIFQISHHIVDTVLLHRVRYIACEYKHLKLEVCWTHVLNLSRTRIGRADENVRAKSLAYNQCGGNVLMGARDNGGRGVVDADPRGEVAITLERTGEPLSRCITVRSNETYERNSSCVSPPSLCSAVATSLDENIAENFLSKAIRSCAYLRRSNSY